MRLAAALSLGFVFLGSLAPDPSPTPPAGVPSSAPTPVTPVPTPTAIALQRIVEAPLISVSRLPAENPYGLVADEPAALIGKPAFPDGPVSAALFAVLRLDSTGKVVQSQIVRDPIPFLSAESRKSLDRWTFEPGIKAGRPVETQASVRLDLQVEVRASKAEPPSLVPVTPSTAIPVPLEWGSDAAWPDSQKPAAPSGSALSLEQLDTPPVPKKTKWSADSFKGAFSSRFWVKVSAAGKIEKSIALQASDPVLIEYFKRTFRAWQLRPARVKGQAVDSWNDLSVAGPISYSVNLKQISMLRKTLPAP